MSGIGVKIKFFNPLGSCFLRIVAIYFESLHNQIFFSFNILFHTSSWIYDTPSLRRCQSNVHQCKSVHLSWIQLYFVSFHSWLTENSCRYKLLLESLLNKTPREHPDFEKLQGTPVKVGNIVHQAFCPNSYCNEFFQRQLWKLTKWHIILTRTFGSVRIFRKCYQFRNLWQELVLQKF